MREQQFVREERDMYVASTSRRHMGEQRRYFPEWADRFVEGVLEVEADRNSYLAGGYAEEFGYRAQPGWSRGVPILEDELPEQSAEAHMQAQATHPGYPLKANPFEGELSMERPRTRNEAAMMAAVTRVATGRGAFVTVSYRQYESGAHLSRTFTRVAAAFALLSWAMRRGRSRWSGR